MPDRDFLGTLFPPRFASAAVAKESWKSLGTASLQRIDWDLNCMDLLIFEHLNGVVPSHSSVGGSASNKDNFGLSILGKIDGLSGIGAGGGFGNSVSVDESGGSSGCEGEHGDCNGS